MYIFHRLGVGIWGTVEPNRILANTVVDNLETKFSLGQLVTVKVER